MTRRERWDAEAQLADHHAAERDERNRARLDDRTEYRRVGGGWYDVDDLPDAQDVLVSPRIGSLFSGYGGLDMGVMAALGGSVAWHVEFDKAPSQDPRPPLARRPQPRRHDGDGLVARSSPWTSSPAGGLARTCPTPASAPA